MIEEHFAAGPGRVSYFRVRHPFPRSSNFDLSPRHLALAVLAVLAVVSASRVQAQTSPLTLPTQPKASQKPAESSGSTVIVDPTHDNPEATAAEAAGPITVVETVSDDSVRRKLQKLLPRYPGVRSIDVEVEDGVVTLTGHVADKEVRDRVRDFVRRVQGVNLVLNRTKTDAQTLTARDLAWQQIEDYADVISRKWLLFVIAFLLVFLGIFLAGLFRKYSETLLLPLAGNPLMRSVLGSVIAGAIVIGGVLLALQLLGMTEAVLSFLGLAGVAALAVGFAFRDIAENFIASIMLGLRRPFRVGDFVEVAGKAGVVKSLNTRATVLVTLDGSQVRIPNAIIFKEVMVNKTASSSVRGSFDVIVPWETSIAAATTAITDALREHEGFIEDPAPRTLVEAIEPAGIRLRSYFWYPARGVDRLKLQSDSLLATKVALQKAGINATSAALQIQVTRDVAPPSSQVSTSGRGRVVPRDKQAGSEVEANLANDTEAAAIASAQLPAHQENEIGQALDVAGKVVSDEGRNLIGEKEASE